jgi:hypothetical protein
MPDTVDEKLACQQGGHVPGRVTSSPVTNARATRARSAAPQASRSPGPSARPSAHPPFPARTSPGKSPSRGAGTNRDARSTRRASSRDTASVARPWPSVETPTVHTDRHNCARRPS